MEDNALVQPVKSTLVKAGDEPNDVEDVKARRRHDDVNLSAEEHPFSGKTHPANGRPLTRLASNERESDTVRQVPDDGWNVERCP